MRTQAESRDVRNCRLYSYAASAAAVFVGSLALLGWLLGIPTLTSVLPGLATMKPNTALCFVLVGVSLWLSQLRAGELNNPPVLKMRGARILSGVVALVGLLTLAEYVFQLNLGLDDVLFPSAVQVAGTLHPGRMSGATALGFFLLGSSVLFMSNRRPYPAQSFALLATLNGLVACMGYLLGARALYDVAVYSSMALHTAILFAVLGLAVLAVRPRIGVMSAVTSEYMGGVLARRILPLVVAVPILFGWLRWRGQVSGIYGTEFGIALRTLGELVTFATLLWLSAVWLNRLDKKRREAEQHIFRLAAIVESSEDAIFSKDLTGTIISWNHGAEKLYGYSAAEIIGKPIATIIPPGMQAEARQFLKEIAAGRPVTREETVRRRKDGSLVNVSLIISPVRDFDGQIVGASTFAHDISKRKRAQEDRERLAAVVDSSDDAIIGKDLDGTITAWNSGAERLFGYSSTEAVGKPILMLLPPERANEEADILTRIRRGQSVEHFETVRVRKDGKRVEVSATISPIKDSGGVIIGASKIARDITERKRSEVRLRESQENYRTLFDSMDEGFCTIKVLFNENDEPVDYRFLEVNPAFEKQTGIPNARGRTMREIAPQHEEHWFAIYGRIALTGEPARFENQAAQLHRWYDVHAFRVGEPHERKVAIFFDDITARKRTEDELARSRQELKDKSLLLQSVLDSMAEGLVVADEQGKFIIWNPAARKIVGLGPANIPSEEWTGHYGLFLPDGVTPFPVAQTPLARAIQGELSSAVMFVRNPDVDQGVFVEAYASPLRDKDGAVRGGVVAFRDISERIRAEERLREYERVVESLEDMILVLDREYRYVIANRAFLNYRGRNKEQVIGRVDEILVRETSESVVKEKMDECFQGKVVQFELDYDYPDRGTKTLNLSYFPIEGAHGIDRIACILRDITQRKRSEEALRTSEERFSKAFRGNPLAITISTRADGRYLDVNDAFLQLLGYKRENVIGRTALDLNFWADPSQRIELLELLAKSGRVAGLRTQYKTAEGELREAEVSAELIEVEGQTCVLAITRDITETQRLEAQFRQAQKMEAVGRLAGGVAHDFNNLLGVIIGYSDLSLGLIAPESPANRYMEQIKKASHRAVGLTRQLLAFSRQQVVFPKILDLNEVVQNVTTMLQRLVGEDVAIAFRPTVPIGSINADSGQIEQILMNLVVNARDAMPGGGEIIIETAHAELDEHYVSQHPGSRAGQYVVLAVSDTGCGMDETTKSQIFEPFFTTKGIGQGTGLGLSTVYGIVKQGGGTIFVYSEPGKGTTFKIYLPRVEGKAEQPAQSHKEADFQGGSETILVVEDDLSLRELTVSMLQGAGYRVIEAGNAEAALDIVKASEPAIELLLTDVIMPGKSGVELLELAKAIRPNLRSLFVSGYTGDLVALRGGLVAEEAFLEKPFTRSSLLKKVRSALHSGQ